MATKTGSEKRIAVVAGYGRLQYDGFTLDNGLLAKALKDIGQIFASTHLKLVRVGVLVDNLQEGRPLRVFNTQANELNHPHTIPQIRAAIENQFPDWLLPKVKVATTEQCYSKARQALFKVVEGEGFEEDYSTLVAAGLIHTMSHRRTRTRSIQDVDIVRGYCPTLVDLPSSEIKFGAGYASLVFKNFNPTFAMQGELFEIAFQSTYSTV